jgi:hypothetical protein
VIYSPVIEVEAKINAKGIHVPKRLVNISILLRIKSATTKKPSTITTLDVEQHCLQLRRAVEPLKVAHRSEYKEAGCSYRMNDEFHLQRKMHPPMPIVAKHSAYTIRA